MILSMIKISNFRCFGNQETVIDFDKITTLIGANSSGKTAVLQALVKLFGQTQIEREIHRSDFHLDKGQKPDEIEKNELYIEAIFKFPELKSDEKSLSTIPAFFRYFVIDEQNQIPYIRIRLDSTFTKDGTPVGSIDTRYNFIVKSIFIEANDDNKGMVNAQRSILSTLIVRANQIGAISNNQYQYLMKQLSQSGYRTIEPYDKDTPICKPRYLKHAVKMMIDEIGISGDEFMDELSDSNLTIYKDMVENLIGLEKGYLNTEKVEQTISLKSR